MPQGWKRKGLMKNDPKDERERHIWKKVYIQLGSIGIVHQEFLVNFENIHNVYQKKGVGPYNTQVPSFHYSPQYPRNQLAHIL